MSSSLRATVDGRPIPPEKAHALWTRFSAHMDAHQGDFDGFAAAEGYASAKVGMIDGQPTLQLVGRDPAAKPKRETNASEAAKPKKKGAPVPGGTAPKDNQKKNPKMNEKKRRKKRPARNRRDESVDIGDAKPKRPRRG